MRDKAASVQRRTWHNFQKAWRTIAQEHLKSAIKYGSMEAKNKEMRGDSRLLHCTAMTTEQIIHRSENQHFDRAHSVIL